MAATINHQLVSMSDAADALVVSTRTIRRYIADGQLEAVRLGRKTLRIKVHSLDRFIDAKHVGNWRRGVARRRHEVEPDQPVRTKCTARGHPSAGIVV